MKKRMFLSTILMTLVLLVAVTTATFAWYQTSASANAITGSQNNVNTVEKVTLTAQAYDLSVTVTLTEVSNKTLQLAHYDGAKSKYVHYYTTDGSNKIEYAGEDGKLDSKAYSISITAVAYNNAGVVLTQAQVAQLIADAGVTVTVSTPTSENPMKERTKLWASEEVIADNAAPGGSTTFDVKTALEDWNGTDKIIGYFAISAEGESASADTTALTLKANVVVSKKA